MRVLGRTLNDHLRRGATFLVVGGIGFVVDAGIYNALVFWGGHGLLADTPLMAKIISIVAASVVTYAGSKVWTFSDSNQPASAAQFVKFMACNVAAIGLQLGCLAFSRYVLNLNDVVSDNVSGTLIGQTLATGFRYITYGRWVFPPPATNSRP